MKIDRIRLNNFRQFYGKQDLNLATDDNQNVTLIHAENGVGKTTLLNAVYWALFADVTKRFEQRDKIVNFEALNEGKRTASVDVSLEVNEVDYLVQRHSTHGDSGSGSLKVFRIDEGAMKPLPAPETFINSVLPKGMARYFFFDGEHAEAFSAETNKDAGQAIRSMLGCDLAEIAIRDLKEIGQQYVKEIGGIPGDNELTELEQRLSRLELEQARDRTAINDHRNTIDIRIEQKEEIEARLRETAGARDIQKLRDELNAQLSATAISLQSARAEIVRWIGAKAISVVARRLTKETLDFIDEESLRGKIPSPYNEEFVRGLLAAEICVCERPFHAGSHEWEAIAKLLRKAGNAEAMRRIMRARGRLTALKESAADAPRLLELAETKVVILIAKRQELEQRIGEQSKQLENFSLDEVRERETSRTIIERQITELNRQIGGLDRDVVARERQISDLNREIEKLAKKNDRARKLLTRRTIALNAGSYLESQLKDYEKNAKGVIQSDVNKILEATARRHYQFRFGDNFSMALLYSDNGLPVPRSSGENQLMSLAFTSALVKFARLRAKASGNILTPGTVAPLVLDAPFGQLDNTYRVDTAKFIPEMAGQVILLVSTSHASQNVLDALRPRVGAEYVLISENRGLRDGKGDDRMEIDGREYIRSRFNQPLNRTVIERVR